jgi:hypothetical protein
VLAKAATALAWIFVAAFAGNVDVVTVCPDPVDRAVGAEIAVLQVLSLKRVTVEASVNVIVTVGVRDIPGVAGEIDWYVMTGGVVRI